MPPLKVSFKIDVLKNITKKLLENESKRILIAFFVTEVDLLGEEVFYILLISSVSKWAGQV